MAQPSARSLPSVDAVLHRPELASALETLPRPLVVEAVRAEIATARKALLSVATNGSRKRRSPRAADAPARNTAVPTDAELATRAAERAGASFVPSFRRVLNATGIVLHTNLGRSPLSKAARQAVDQVARGYSNLEFELDSGRRGGRGAGVESWLTRLTGAESALVVNNGAAAILVTLSALAAGRPVIVSRGELVEIGGSFRVPDVMEKSGAELVEIGTTNRTHLRDYERALTKHKNAAAILRVHRSNFRIQGFTTQPEIPELAKLAKKHKVALIEDLGSGALVDLSALGLEREPTVGESLKSGCDVVTFSGDKLLGSTQAGIILGRKKFLEKIKKDPLVRALRIDKLTIAALEATLPAYLDPARAAREIPALAMLATPAAELEKRAHALAEALKQSLPDLDIQVEPGSGEVGGGALPLQRLPGWVVSVSHPRLGADALDAKSRSADPPVIGYIRDGRFRLDVRTLADDEIREAAQALARAVGA
jgi:L-seryl-tRNA(Ser) seleniumtransferase